jgi:transposase-like protein
VLATDPISDLPVAFALVDKNDQDHMRRFLKNLKNHGLAPQVIITDGSTLYPKLLEELWPEAEHQLCVFHVLQDVNKKILQAVLRLRRGLARRGQRGRKRRRGRPRKTQKRQQHKKQKEKAKFIFKRRYLIVKRRDGLREQEQKDLKVLLGYLPALRPLRDFADAMQRLLAAEQTEEQAQGRWRRLHKQARYLAVPELKSVLETTLSQEKFAKMIAFLRNPAAPQVRTNNHVERCNRQLRYWEKVRYKWRRRRTLVRFLVLALDQWWQRELPRRLAAQAAAKAKAAKTKRKPSPRSKEFNTSTSQHSDPAMPSKRRKAA